jgi:LmbE family N-acetylglucosaminyl deacetylase
MRRGFPAEGRYNLFSLSVIHAVSREPMKAVLRFIIILIGALFPVALLAQAPKPVPGADERFKVDILVVVAHPDDEGAITPYLARAIYDLHKKVAVVYGTRGGSGANEYGREHGPAMANIREMEARQACARLDITNVWFLDGKDTASQNVLNSLASWGHGESLERLVGLVRLTRPEIIMTWLPGVFIGENHGDHQAAGVLATEAFDLAADPVVFPSQVTGPSKRLEPYLENLQTWQAKKIYYFEDSSSGPKRFADSGPSYSIKDISPSKKQPYWRLAFDAIKPHMTQFGEFIQSLEKMNEEQLSKMIDDPDFGWPEPETLIFGKSYYVSKSTNDVFANLEGKTTDCPLTTGAQASSENTFVALGGPWAFYEKFRKAHCLQNLLVADPLEIGVKAGTTLSLPLTIHHDQKRTLEVTISAELPQGWKVFNGAGKFLFPAEADTDVRVEIETPTLTEAELKKAMPQLVKVKVEANGKSVGEAKVDVLLKASSLPQ